MNNIQLLQKYKIYIFYTLLTIFILLNLYYLLFHQVLLCDSIQDLKDDLQGDLARLREDCHDYEVFCKLHQLQKLNALESGDSSIINWNIMHRAYNKNAEAHAIIRSIRRKAVIIRRIEPGFKPPLELILSRYKRILSKGIVRLRA